MKSKVYLRFMLIWNLWGSTTEEKMGFRAPFYIQEFQIDRGVFNKRTLVSSKRVPLHTIAPRETTGISAPNEEAVIFIISSLSVLQPD